MLNENNFANAQNLLNSLGSDKKVKRIRKEAGLIERAQSDEKIILTEDIKISSWKWTKSRPKSKGDYQILKNIKNAYTHLEIVLKNST